jgi:MSHA biogenesis protein MshO
MNVALPYGTRIRGFTMVELVAVITITGIIASFIALNLSRPVEGFVGATRRAQLVGAAESALSRMGRELRLALPNSVRMPNAVSLEFLRTLDGGRYRSAADSSGNGTALSFTAASGSFDVLGPLPNAADIRAGAGGRALCMAGSIDCLAIYNTGQTGANAYAGDNLAGITSVISGATIQIAFDGAAGWHFPYTSPQKRFQIVDAAVMFVCDTTAGTLTRYAGYAISISTTVPPSGGSSAVLADKLTGCSMSYSAGTATRSALVTFALTLADSGESVRLLQQIGVPNLP